MQPASIRYNNPLAMYPGPSAQRFGSSGHAVIGGGHKIAAFDDPISGAAGNFDLMDRNYAGMPIEGLIGKWSGGNNVGTYLKSVGLPAGTVVTREMIRDPEFATRLAKSMAGHEAGRPGALNDDQWREAHRRAFGGGGDGPAQSNPSPVSSQPVSSGQPMIQPRQTEDEGIGDLISNRVFNPLTQAGLGLFLASAQGGDMAAGWQGGAQLGQQAQNQQIKLRQMRQQEAERAKARAALEQGIGGMQNLSQSERGMLMSNPDLAEKVMSGVLQRRFDPDAEDRSRLLRAQADNAANPSTEDIKNFREAKNNGFGGSFMDYMKTSKSHGLGMTPIYGTGPDGRAMVLQMGQGELVPSKMPEGVNIDPRGAMKIDTGTGTAIVGPGGQTRAIINKDVAGAASQKEIGEIQGKASGDLPRVLDNAQRTLKTIEQIRGHEGKQYGLGAAGILPGIPGTAQRGFVNLVEQAKGQVFLEAFNSLRGGGAITETEGAKATQALSRLDRAQTPQDFEAALADVEEIVTIGIARARAMAARQPGQAPQQAPTSQSMQQGQQGGSAPIRVQSVEEAMRLPPGTVFMTPDGRLKERP